MWRCCENHNIVWTCYDMNYVRYLRHTFIAGARSFPGFSFILFCFFSSFFFAMRAYKYDDLSFLSSFSFWYSFGAARRCSVTLLYGAKDHIYIYIRVRRGKEAVMLSFQTRRILAAKDCGALLGKNVFTKCMMMSTTDELQQNSYACACSWQRHKIFTCAHLWPFRRVVRFLFVI